jgi:hypothetical protein
MNTLFFSSRDDLVTRTLKIAIQQAVPVSQIEFFDKLEDIEARLRTPLEPDSIAVLSVSNRAELLKMQLLRRLLPEIYVILIIPDRKKSTLALAHLLLPRFLIQQGSDFEDLKIVLHKMYTNSLQPRVEALFSEN